MNASSLRPVHVVYLHGFCSSSASWKACLLAEEMRRRHLEAYWHCPDLPFAPAEAWSMIRRLVVSLQPEPVVFAGSSLGGHYATLCAETFHSRAVLINPAVIESIDLSLFLGEQKHLYRDEKFIFTAEHGAQLQAQCVVPQVNRYWLLQESGDEVLDYRAAARRYAGCRHTLLAGGNHSFSAFPEYVGAIVDWLQTGITEVAAAVFLRQLSAHKPAEFLLACRPEGKAYAGYWEFPGGKLEGQESVEDALVREIQEEMGVTVTAQSPWLTREFLYPHAHVRIHFQRVSAWRGEIANNAALEHSALSWQPCWSKNNSAQAASQIAGDRSAPLESATLVSPLLPANQVIVKALSLPTCCCLTRAERTACPAALKALESALRQAEQRGERLLIQVRDKTLPPRERAAWAADVVRLARAFSALVVINDDPKLARDCAADGVHLSAASLRACRVRPADCAWVGASCHSPEELVLAATLGLDYALLSPVMPTATHPDVPALGWQTLADWCRHSTIPVFALGGLQREDLPTAQQHGAHGVALLSGY